MDIDLQPYACTFLTLWMNNFNPQKMTGWTFGAFLRPCPGAKLRRVSAAPNMSYSSGHSCIKETNIKLICPQGGEALPDLLSSVPNPPSLVQPGKPGKIPAGSWGPWVTSAPKWHHRGQQIHKEGTNFSPALRLHRLQSHKLIYFYHELLGSSTEPRRKPLWKQQEVLDGKFGPVIFPSTVFLSWHVSQGFAGTSPPPHHGLRKDDSLKQRGINILLLLFPPPSLFSLTEKAKKNYVSHRITEWFEWRGP